MGSRQKTAVGKWPFFLVLGRKSSEPLKTAGSARRSRKFWRRYFCSPFWRHLLSGAFHPSAASPFHDASCHDVFSGWGCRRCRWNIRQQPPNTAQLILFILAIFLLAGCGRNTRDWNKVYSQAREKAERWDSVVARQLTEEGLKGTPSDPRLNYQFLALKAELLLNDGKPQEALRLLELPPPPELASSEFAARRKGIQGRAYALLEDKENAKLYLTEARE